MNPLDQQLQAVIAILQAAGGKVGIDPGAPDYVKKAFLDMLLQCKDCRSVMMGAHDGKGN